MTRILLIAATLAMVASTSFAAVTITATQNPTELTQFTISYSATEAIRDFALDIYITDSNAEIDSISGYDVGDDNGYGIFPGRFREAGLDPADPNWANENYNPTAAGGDPDRQPGLGYAGITVEMGSLYTAGNEPPLSGDLFVIDINANGSGDCNLCIALNETRGGIVNENAEEVTATLPPCTTYPLEVTTCIPPTHPDYAAWDMVGQPQCWCNPRQCHGDAEGEGALPQGSPKSGYYYVGTNDLNILSAAWLVLEPTKGPGIASVTNGICADFNRDLQGSPKSGYYYVGTNDLNVLTAYWLVLEPTKGLGVPADCQ